MSKCGLEIHKYGICKRILYENGSKIDSIFGVLTLELDQTRC